jgi:hypothetical protein
MKKCVVGFLLALTGIVWSQIIVWSNPDMSNQRLWIEFWPQLLPCIILVFVGALLAYRGAYPNG